MKFPVILVSMLVIICLFGSSCDKFELMPSATTSGAGTMGFYVDGKKWVAQSNDFKLSQTKANLESSGLFISAVNNSVSHIDILLSDPKVGSYQFSTRDIVEYKQYGSFPTFSLDINDPSNNLIITHYDSKIISGAFSFKLKSPGGAIVSLTSGRFDIGINP